MSHEPSPSHDRRERHPEPGVQPDSDESAVRGRLTPKRLAVQIGFSVIGFGLLGWVLIEALQSGSLDRIREAEPWQIIGLAGATLISLFANGAIFWVLYEPVRREKQPSTPAPSRVSEAGHQANSDHGPNGTSPDPPVRRGLPRLTFATLLHLNTAVSFLNYAPVRLGLIVRLIYHRQVDRLRVSVLFAWMAAYGVLYLGVVGSVLGATLLRPAVDIWWLVCFVGLLTIGALVLIYGGSHGLIRDRLRGADRFFSHPVGVISALVLRVIDTAAFGARLYIAFLILGITLEPRDAILLTLASMLTGILLPVGNLGFRDSAVTWIGTLLADEGLQNQVSAAAVFDRAGEAVVFIPLGIISCLWLGRRWHRRATGGVVGPSG